MGDLLGEGAAWLEAQRREHLTLTVTYRRGTQEVELPATKGRRVFEITDEGGLNTTLESTDWIVTAEDLELDGSRITPKRGDQIVEVIEGRTSTFEVLEIPGVPVSSWTDPRQISRRIHTKLVKTD